MREHFGAKAAINLNMKAKLVKQYSYNSLCSFLGVFGAGKSYLLAVIVLYLVELFIVSESLNQERCI